MKFAVLDSNGPSNLIRRSVDLAEARRPADLGQALLLGLEPGPLHEKIDHLRGKSTLLRPDFPAAELDQHVAGTNPLTLMDADCGNDSAVAVLDRLTLARDLELAGRVGRRVHRREGRPTEEQNKEEHRDDGANP